MIKAILARIQQGHRTMKFPAGAAPSMPDRFRGKPEIENSPCPEGCRACVDACPTGAVARDGAPSLDLGKCIFCVDCEEACPRGAISFTKDYRLAVRDRGALVLGQERREIALAAALDKKLKRLFGRSLKLRQLSAGGCNACESDVNVLNTVVWDLGRFGIQFVASPRHADGLLITGPVTKNMELALRKTYDAIPEPKIVIVAGSCAITGGLFIDHAEVDNGASKLLPVDLFIPGCPPHPLTILDGLLRLTGRIKEGRR
ncbi:MAG: NADH-quinone oxidoreductase subunit NuoB [Rectinemataceae bacterium]|jgi:Ni,Fe-hydrogenase III small subunit/NAD-dependent dihydropyrimidine dehydrogenase PreA subunit